jgi:hypothetical protein
MRLHACAHTHTHSYVDTDHSFYLFIYYLFILFVFANIRIAQLLLQVALSDNAVMSGWKVFNYLQLHQISKSVFDKRETCLTILVYATQKLLPFGFLKFLL